MKTIINSFFFAFCFLFVAINANAQTSIPQLVSFSAEVRDANNNLLVNTDISIRLTFRQGGAQGTIAYCALHQEQTNQNGFFSVQLNRNILGTACNGAPNLSFDAIPWEGGNYWLQVEYQTIPGTPFVDLGALELTSTFYAFSARTAERVVGFSLSGAQDGQVLTYNSNTQQWVPTTPTASTLNLQQVLSNGNTAGGSSLSNVGDLNIGNNNSFSIGDPNTNGSWRFRMVGNDLNIERRENGAWVNKFQVNP